MVSRTKTGAKRRTVHPPIRARARPRRSLDIDTAAPAAADECAVTLTDAIFRAAIDSSPDLIFIIDPATMRFLYVNQTACRMEGYTREEYLKLTSMDVMHMERAELERAYRDTIAAGEAGITIRFRAVGRDGRRGWFEAHRRALRVDGRWIIATVTRDISERRRAENAARCQSRMYAALTATNEAIMHATSRTELYRQVCDAAVQGGKFITTAVLIPDRERSAKVVAVSGQQELHEARISVDAATPQGQGIIGIAFRTRATCVSNDFLNDPRTRPWHKHAARLNIAASAAVPLVHGERTFGVLLFHAADKRTFNDDVIGLLERMARNISFALDNFDRDAERRFTRMYATLSATNEAIMHAASPTELYQLVCDAAVHDGKFGHAAVLIPGPDATLAVVAERGGSAPTPTPAVALDHAPSQGWSLVSRAFRTLKPCVSNALANETCVRPWCPAPESTGSCAGAVLPILRGGRAAGALALFAPEPGAFDGEIVTLLERMARNIAFALDNFEHETERKHAAERIQYLATHDGLTALPNRVMFNQLLRVAIETAQRYHRKFAVLLIDLDRFKLINDALGHEVGDLLLQEMVARLGRAVRASDVVARLGGDEFVVLLQEVGEAEHVAAVARKILSAVMKPMVLVQQECRVTASIGICLYECDAANGQTLMKNAEMAMYHAKEEGKNNFQFYSPRTATPSLERLTLETNLRRALERNELSLHYQAKLDLGRATITGTEALLRWTSPELGAVSPAQFIPLAEETGLIVPIGRWVLHTACAQNVAWQRQGLPPAHVAVNLSARQFTDENLLQDIAAALAQSGMAPQQLELEITEGTVIHNPERASKLLAAIKQMGVRLAIDDFGTGYSSLAQVKRFPIDTLKIDRSFIRDIPSDAEDKAITQAVIAMGKTLSLTVVAEGVETFEQMEFLRAHGCDEIQGYYFSKPIAAERFAELLRAHGPARP